MNVQRFGLAAVAVFVVYAVIYLGGGMIFEDQYAAVMAAFGMNESESWMNWAGRILFTLVFVYIFVQGHENKGIAEGVRYGLLIGLLMVGVSLDLYGWTDIAMGTIFVALVTDLVANIAAGAAAAAVYKPADVAPAEAAPAEAPPAGGTE